VSAHWGKALGKVKCPSGGSAMMRAGTDAWWWRDGVAREVVSNASSWMLAVTVLLLLYGCCWLEPGTQICRTQGG
jgi:hypothetical protein